MNNQPEDHRPNHEANVADPDDVELSPDVPVAAEATPRVASTAETSGAQLRFAFPLLVPQAVIGRRTADRAPSSSPASPPPPADRGRSRSPSAAGSPDLGRDRAHSPPDAGRRRRGSDARSSGQDAAQAFARGLGSFVDGFFQQVLQQAPNSASPSGQRSANASGEAPANAGGSAPRRAPADAREALPRDIERIVGGLFPYVLNVVVASPSPSRSAPTASAAAQETPTANTETPQERPHRATLHFTVFNSAPITFTNSPTNPLAELFGNIFGGIAGDPRDYAFSPQRLDEIVSQLMEQYANTSRPPPASNETIESLPRHTIAQIDVDARKECVVCTDAFEKDALVLELPCHHLFHPECVTSWLKINGSCPTCRYSLISKPTPTTSA